MGRWGAPLKHGDMGSTANMWEVRSTCISGRTSLSRGKMGNTPTHQMVGASLACGEMESTSNNCGTSSTRGKTGNTSTMWGDGSTPTQGEKRSTSNPGEIAVGELGTTPTRSPRQGRHGVRGEQTSCFIHITLFGDAFIQDETHSHSQGR